MVKQNSDLASLTKIKFSEFLKVLLKSLDLNSYNPMSCIPSFQPGCGHDFASKRRQQDA